MILAVGLSESNGHGVSHSVPASSPSDLLLAGKRAFEERTNANLQALRDSTAIVIGELRDSGPRILELGCGHGHFLTEFARLNPQSQCLGVDFCRDRIRRASRKQSRAGLENLRFFRAEARQFLMTLPPKVLFSYVFVLFPDPWPKRRHRKNRLMTTDFLSRLANVTATLGRVYFRSDATDYVSEVRTAVERHPRWALRTEEPLPLEAATVFQQRAESYGTVVAELVSEAKPTTTPQ